MIIRVGKDREYKTINTAYYWANSGDTLWIDEGVYEEEIKMTSGKYVHIVGNSKRGEAYRGRVVIKPPVNKNVLYFNGIIESPTVLIEGIYLYFTVNSYATTADEVVEISNCKGMELIFNKCIISATYDWKYVFQCNTNALKSITIKNCNVVWKDDDTYSGSSASHFVRSAKDVLFTIEKSVLSNNIENISTANFTQPYSISNRSEYSPVLEDSFVGTVLDSDKWLTYTVPNASVTVNDALELNNMVGNKHSGAICYSNQMFETINSSYVYILTCKWMPHKNHYSSAWGVDISFFNPYITFDTTYAAVCDKYIKIVLGRHDNTTDRTVIHIYTGGVNANSVSKNIVTSVGVNIDETVWHDLEIVMDFKTVTVYLDRYGSTPYSMSSSIPQHIVDALATIFKVGFSSSDYEKTNTEKFKDVVLKRATVKYDSKTADYIISNIKEGYGPKYGTSLSTVPTQYYFSGSVIDKDNEGILVDTVILNNSDKHDKLTLTNDNLSVTILECVHGANYVVRATVGRTTGKWYWECVLTGTLGIGGYGSSIGVSTSNLLLTERVGSNVYSWGYIPITGQFMFKGSTIKTGPRAKLGDVIGIALDCYNKKMWFSLNGVWLLNGDPSLGINAIFKDITGEVFPTAALSSSYLYIPTVKFTFAKGELKYPIPTDYSFYGTGIVWPLALIHKNSNQLIGITFTEFLHNTFYIETPYNDEHLLIATDSHRSELTTDEALWGRIKIDAMSMDQPLINFPVRVCLTIEHTDLFNLINNNFQKLRFKTDNLTNLYCEVEFWGYQKAILWVSPTIYPNVTTYINIYITSVLDFVYIGLTGSLSAQRVWDTNFKVVYNMTQDPSVSGAYVLDSTSNANHGIPYGMSASTLVDGLVGKALELDGVNDYIKVPHNPSWKPTTDVTITMFFKKCGNTEVYPYPGLLTVASEIDDAWNDFTLIGMWHYRDNWIQIASSPLGGSFTFGDPQDLDNTWLVFTISSSISEMITSHYRDDIKLNTKSRGGSFTWGSDTHLFIGLCEHARYSHFMLEHFSISHVSRTEAWVKATNRSLRNTLCTIEKVQNETSSTISTLSITQDRTLIIGPVIPERFI